MKTENKVVWGLTGVMAFLGLDALIRGIVGIFGYVFALLIFYLLFKACIVTIPNFFILGLKGKKNPRSRALATTASAGDEPHKA